MATSRLPSHSEVGSWHGVQNPVEYSDSGVHMYPVGHSLFSEQTAPGRGQKLGLSRDPDCPKTN